jgi:hypothetical protein
MLRALAIAAATILLAPTAPADHASLRLDNGLWFKRGKRAPSTTTFAVASAT